MGLAPACLEWLRIFDMNHAPYTNAIRSWFSYPKKAPKASLQNSIISHDRILSYFGYMRLYAVEYSLGFISLAITTFTEVMSPKLTGWTVDLISSQHAMEGAKPTSITQYLHAVGFHSPRSQLYGLALVFSINMLIGLLFRFLWRQFLARRTHHASFVYRMRYWSALRFTSLSQLSKKTADEKNQDFTGDLISRGIADINPVRFIHGFTWAGTLDVLFFLIAGSISMIWIDPLLALYCLAIFPLASIPVWFLSEKQKIYHQDAQQALAELSDTIGQAVSTARLQRATATEGFWKHRLETEAKTYAGKSLKAF
jgi:ABC-type multidrug transport system fused ATPase/permease subunit